MDYSVTFAGEKNTWADWKLIPESPPVVPPPTPNINLVDIPFRAKGPIDMSTYPLGRLTYQRISGSWNFITLLEDQHDRANLYEMIRTWLHARTATVVLSDDPEHYYKGIFTVGGMMPGANTASITIAYNLEPVRYNRDGSIDTSFVRT